MAVLGVAVGGLILDRTVLQTGLSGPKESRASEIREEPATAKAAPVAGDAALADALDRAGADVRGEGARAFALPAAWLPTTAKAEQAPSVIVTTAAVKQAMPTLRVTGIQHGNQGKPGLALLEVEADVVSKEGAAHREKVTRPFVQGEAVKLPGAEGARITLKAINATTLTLVVNGTDVEVELPENLRSSGREAKSAG